MINHFLEAQQQMIQTRAERDAQDDRLQVRRAELRQVEARLADLERQGRAHPNDPIGVEVLQLRDALQHEIQEREQSLVQHKDRLSELSGHFAELIASPQELTAQLDDAYPVLLFPIRLETKFMKVKERDELWVRIFPDDILIETHEAALTAEEIEAGQDYWEAIWRAGGNLGRELGAWRVLVNRYRAPRAAWIAKQLAPTNPADKPVAPIDPAEPLPVEPIFNPPDLKSTAWSRAPRVRLMPDRFVIMTFAGGNNIHAQVGRFIPDPVIVGPDPLQLAGSLKQVGEDLQVDPDMVWMTDFAAAEAIGLGIRLLLTPAQAALKYDRILALGLRFSSDAQDAQQRLEALFESHHYGKGLALVPQGTPTNNTEDGAAGYRRFEFDVEDSYHSEMDAALFAATAIDPIEQSDGQRLANALGIRYSSLQHVREAGISDAREAWAMNTALWPATWGYFLEEMLQPNLDLTTIKRTREFFTRCVSGRGALPALRVGKQPYGILPTTVFSRVKFFERDHFLMSLTQVLQRLDGKWNDMRGGVAHAGHTSDHGADLIDALGLHPTSEEYWQRFAAGPDYQWNRLIFMGAGPFAKKWSDLVQNRAAQLRAELPDLISPAAKILKLTYMSRASRLTGPVVDDAPLSEELPIKVIAANDPAFNINYIQWLLTRTLDDIRAENFGIDAPTSKKRQPPAALLYLMLRHALTNSYWDTTTRLLGNAGAIDLKVRREVEIQHVRKPEVTRWDYFDARLPNVNANLTLGEYLTQLRPIDIINGEHAFELRELQEIKSALAVLADLPTARLERLFAEHVDLASYRLDAWLLGLANYRLQIEPFNLVGEGDGGQHDPDQPPRPGIYLGAFGWLENLERAQPRQIVPANEIPEGFADPVRPLTYAPENGGYVHAPSLTHAATAAMLRSAYLTHTDPTQHELLSVNLSSDRVRRAQWYLEGMRNGQTLAALLGYQFERGLHDRALTLNRFILPFRKKFPIAVDPGKAVPPDTSVEAIAASNVVDGLKLVQAARQGPFPYGVTLPALPVPTPDEVKAIQDQVERIKNDLDAVSDVALSEGVYQVAQGNFDRAAAMLDAIGQGGNIPEPEIINTPRSGVGLTHRVMINLGASAVPAASPRGIAEPRLNAWVSEALGSLNDIACLVDYADPNTAVTVRLSDLGLQPIDFIYLTAADLAGDETELENRIAYHVKQADGLPHDKVLKFRFMREGVGWPIGAKPLYEVLPLAKALRDIVAGCRALGADDFVLPGDVIPDVKNRKQYDVVDLQSRVNSALGALQSAQAALATDPNDPDGAALTPTEFNDLRAALIVAAQFGVSHAIPSYVIEDSPEARHDVIAQAVRVQAELLKRATQADALLTQAATLAAAEVDAKADRLVQAARAIFGPAFKIMPLFNLHRPTEVQLAYDQRTVIVGSDPFVVDEWLQGLSLVRAKIADYETARIAAELLSDNAEVPFDMSVTQLPFVANEPWCALPVAAKDIHSDKLSLVMHTANGYTAATQQAGLLIDEWVEVIPGEMETTGIVFNFDQPNSEPPQTLLLVVPPERTGHWQWQDLVDTLHETLDLAKKRAVEPRQIDEQALAQALPAIMMAVTRYQSTFSVDLARNLKIGLYGTK
jgi:hypothetical protein